MSNNKKPISRNTSYSVTEISVKPSWTTIVAKTASQYKAEKQEQQFIAEAIKRSLIIKIPNKCRKDVEVSYIANGTDK